MKTPQPVLPYWTSTNIYTSSLLYRIPVFQTAKTSSVLPWMFRGCISKDNDKVLIKLKEEKKELLGDHDILKILDYGETDDDHKIDSVS